MLYKSIFNLVFTHLKIMFRDALNIYTDSQERSKEKEIKPWFLKVCVNWRNGTWAEQIILS